LFEIVFVRISLADLGIIQGCGCVDVVSLVLLEMCLQDTAGQCLNVELSLLDKFHLCIVGITYASFTYQQLCSWLT